MDLNAARYWTLLLLFIPPISQSPPIEANLYDDGSSVSTEVLLNRISTSPASVIPSSQRSSQTTAPVENSQPSSDTGSNSSTGGDSDLAQSHNAPITESQLPESTDAAAIADNEPAAITFVASERLRLKNDIKRLANEVQDTGCIPTVIH